MGSSNGRIYYRFKDEVERLNMNVKYDKVHDRYIKLLNGGVDLNKVSMRMTFRQEIPEFHSGEKVETKFVLEVYGMTHGFSVGTLFINWLRRKMKMNNILYFTEMYIDGILSMSLNKIGE